jgi:hypothetical protein
MVIINGVINFIFRAPEMLFWMENKSILSSLYSHIKRYNNVYDNHMAYSYDKIAKENTPGLLNLIADIGYLSYILTFTTNFVIFYSFNKNFKEVIVFP